MLFDDFHYTGVDDPALQAHGWQARSSAGGPGIENTWQPSAVSFPHLSTAQGGQALQLQVTTNGTSAGTSQAELVSTSPRFFTGSYAARIYFPNTPSSGEGGDNIVESFYLISPPTDSQQYSELDYEYMPNGGWGSTRPELDVVSWHSAKGGDRVYTPSYRRLTGWHTVQVNSIDGVTAYFLDGERITTVDEAHSLRDAVNVDFSAWLIDLSTTGSRTWDVDVNWFYYQAGKALTPESLDTAVGDYLGAATNYVNTLN